MRHQAVSGLRLSAAFAVKELRRQLAALDDRDFSAHARAREERRITEAIQATYNRARLAVMGEIAVVRERVLENRPRARRLRGALAHPERAAAVAKLAAQLPPEDLLRMARAAVAAGDEAAQHGLMAGCSEILASAVHREGGGPDLSAVISTLSAPTEEEERLLADLLVCRHEQAMLDAEESSALLLHAPPDGDGKMLERLNEALHVELEGEDALDFTDEDVARARKMIGSTWCPAEFEVPKPEPTP